jgi:hypothetical protein
MTIEGARKWIIVTSLAVTSAVFVFFFLAPQFGYPLVWEQSERIIEIVLPVFLGYMGTATHFLFHQNRSQMQIDLGANASLLGLIVRGPIIVFALACGAILFAFGYSNRLAAPQDSGMSIDQLSWAVAAALGLLSGTTSVAVSYLFSLGEKAEAHVAPAKAGKKRGPR